MLPYAEIKEYVVNKLEKGLSRELTYHNVNHTLDVLRQAEVIASEEGIVDENDLLVLKVSALYHDVGFIDRYGGHEERSCEVAEAELKEFGFNNDQLNQIIGLIRATKVPQQPQTKLEEIICDSDLDYLGRSDFFILAKGLYKEFIDQKIVVDFADWNRLQVSFLEGHHYFTNSSKRRRQQQKEIHVEAVKRKLEYKFDPAAKY